MNGPVPDDARCRALLSELSRYLDGELTGLRCRQIERHIRSCACCATMAEGLRETLDACREAREHPLPDDVRDRARARIKALIDRPHPAPGRRRPRVEPSS